MRERTPYAGCGWPTQRSRSLARRWLNAALLTGLPALLSVASPAHAADLDAALVQRVVVEVVKRVPLKDLTKVAVATTRRAVSVGPHVGAALGTGVPTGTDAPISLGLTALVFSNPLLDLTHLQALATQLLEQELNDALRVHIRERLRREVGHTVFDAVRAGVRGARKEGVEAGVEAGLQVGAKAGKSALGQLRDADYAAIAQQVWGRLSGRLKARLLSDNTRLPDPRFGGWLELTKLPRSDAWQVRLGTGFGLSKLTLGPALAIHTSSPRSVALGLEATVNTHWGRGPRPWLVQGFARYEWFLRRHASFGHQAALGVRCVFDLL